MLSKEKVKMDNIILIFRTPTYGDITWSCKVKIRLFLQTQGDYDQQRAEKNNHLGP